MGLHVLRDDDVPEYIVSNHVRRVLTEVFCVMEQSRKVC